MSAEQNPQVQMLLAKSAEDEETLRFDVPDAIFEFHTQQALEKLLKVLIAAHGNPFPFIHDLRVLAEQVKSLGETLPQFEIALPEFTKFGVLVRYDCGVPLNTMERARYRRIVEQLRLFVVERIALLP